MALHIRIFGQLTDIVGKSITVDPVKDTDGLIIVLHTLYPELADVHYVIAVNKKVIKENTILSQDCTVALLPPFSGG